MAQEIERKFLVRDEDWREAATRAIPLKQGYLCADPRVTVRVRIAGDAAWLTLKGASRGISRSEYEYSLPLDEAESMLAELALSGVVEKTRYLVPHAGRRWEVDVFEGANRGLVLAEVELARADERPEIPPWAGEEVSGDERYYNAYLAAHPFSTWGLA